ncbi:MAG: asparagine synthase-related protein [Candidatus Acidiferrales bacterium]
MSGFVGIWNLDGAPVDRALLERMTRYMAFRGPDAQEIWCEGPVGLGHALLQIEAGPAVDKQPAQLEGRLWIVSHARLDARADLIAKLIAKSPAVGKLSLSSTDAELLLHAYDVWGDACPEHLLGDFSFAIWDAARRRMFCARDHFGLRMFYYAQAGNTFLFSNTLDCLRFHPGISDRLNDLAIADFLMFDANQDLATTTYADILRLPPAHSLVCSQEGVTLRRYWTLPEEAPLRYKRSQDCIDDFRQVFDTAVSDRLRGNSAGILMSGGLDSTTVAISARRVVDRRGSPFDLRAVTQFHETLIPHEEKYYAGLAGQALRVPVQFMNGDVCQLFDIWDDPEYRLPEPIHFAMGFRHCNPYEEVASWSRTALMGYGGDPALSCLLSVHLRKLYRERKFLQLFGDAAGYLMAEGRISRLYPRTRLWRLFHPNGIRDDFPPWLNPDLVSRLSLRDRWERMGVESHPNHSARPEAYESVASRYWTPLVEQLDASVTHLPLEVLHPFFDLRVLELLLALPALPWCSDKEILRRAARGILPDAVRLRKKSPLLADPITALLQRPESAWLDRFEMAPKLT